MALGLAATAPNAVGRSRAVTYLRTGAGTMLGGMVAAWVFLGGFVLFEPSPYELMFLALLPVAFIAGVNLHRATLPLLGIFVFFVPFALIGAFQSTYISITDALIFVGVTIFLLFTSYFAANYIADAPQKHLRLMMTAYGWAAMAAAAIGTLAYLGLIPGAETFLRYGRAKALFQDPNVYGPFLIPPAMFALQRMLLGTGRRSLWAAAMLGVLSIGVFVSFSRGAWGHMLASALIVFIACFLLQANARQKVRMLLLAIVGAGMLLVTLAGLLSIPSVNALFATRFSAEQTYDTGETGRFGRQGYAFDLALANPLGIGPAQFHNLRISEEPHNTYVNVLHVYGWGGGLAFYAFFALTLWRGVRAFAIPSPNRLLMIPLVASFVPLAIECAIIDADHWRHLFLVAGMIWGVSAGYRRVGPGEDRPGAALI